MVFKLCEHNKISTFVGRVNGNGDDDQEHSAGVVQILNFRRIGDVPESDRQSERFVVDRPFDHPVSGTLQPSVLSQAHVQCIANICKK